MCELERLLKEEGYSYYWDKDKIVVDHKGYVDLRSLIKIATDISFINEGSVGLSKLIKIPINISFNNKGYVFLDNINSIKIDNKVYKLKTIDGYTMIILNERVKDDLIIYKTRYMKGGSFDQLPKAFVVKKGDHYSHGETLKQAIDSVNFKFLQETFDLSKKIKEIKTRKSISRVDYRLVTGACEFGVKQFCLDNKIPDDQEFIDLDLALKIIKGHYGYDRFVELLG